jgi:hypothetical protein
MGLRGVEKRLEVHGFYLKKAFLHHGFVLLPPVGYALTLSGLVYDSYFEPLYVLLVGGPSGTFRSDL